MVGQHHISPFCYFADKFCVLRIYLNIFPSTSCNFFSSGRDIFIENDT